MSVTRQRSPFLTHPPRIVRRRAVVAAGDDDVPDRGSAAVGQVDLAPSTAPSSEQPFGAGAFVERADGAGRLGHEDAGPAGGAVGSPGLVGGVEHLVGDAFADSLVAGVGRDDLDVAAAQREGRVLLPLVGEAVDLGQFGCVGAPVDEEREGARRRRRTGVGGGRRRAAPWRPRPAAIPVSRSSVVVSGEGGLVDDHQLPARGVRCGRGRTRGATSPCCRRRRRGRRPAPGQPRRTAPDRRRSPARARRSTLHGALASWWSCLPRPDRRAGRPGGPTWRCSPPRGRCCALSWTFPVAAARAATLAAHRRRGHLLGTSQQARLGLEDRGRGVLLAVPRTEHGSCRPRAGTGPGWSRAPAGSATTDRDWAASTTMADDRLAVLGRREPQVHGLLRRLGHQVPVRPHRPLHADTAATTSAPIASIAASGTSSAVSGSPAAADQRRATTPSARSPTARRRAVASRLSGRRAIGPPSAGGWRASPGRGARRWSSLTASVRGGRRTRR